MSLPDGRKSFDDIWIHFDTIEQRDGETETVKQYRADSTQTHDKNYDALCV